MSVFKTYLEGRKSRQQAPAHATLAMVEEQFIELSKADLRPGLAHDQFIRAVEQVIWLDKYIKDTGCSKASAMADWLVDNSHARISPWTAKTLGFLAHDYARKKGLLQ